MTELTKLSGWNPVEALILFFFRFLLSNCLNWKIYCDDHSSLSFFTFILYYSYQYNMKIVGVPLISESESAQDTAELCVKLFSGLGVDVSISEIDIAHRVPQRDTSTGNGNRRQPNPIICKFTRRMTRNTVLASRGNASRLTTEDLDLPSTAEINRIAIYSHLTPRLQELLHSAKAHQNTYDYKWCWAKGAAIFLRKTDSSR